MIPIQCPRCGRTGNVPPDRLNARLVCKGCQSAFHMDAGGRMVLGDPNDSASTKSKKARAAAPPVDIDLAQTWRDFPKPVKFGLPTAFVFLAGWMWFPDLSSGLAYQDQAEAIGQAMLSGDKTRVIAMATPDTADSAGKFYDVIHAPMSKNAGTTVRAALLDGNPEKDSSVSLGVIVVDSSPSTTFTLQMVKQEGQWKLDGAKSCEIAERSIVPVKLAKKR